MSKDRPRGDFLKLTLKRAFGLRFVVSVLLGCLFLLLDTEESVRQVLLGLYEPQRYDGTILYFEYVLMYGANYKLFLLFMTMGFATSIPLDWKAGILQKGSKDVGIRKMSCIYVGVAALGGGFSVAGSFILYIGLLCTRYPLFPVDYQISNTYAFLQDMPYYGAFTPKDIYLFIIIIVFIFFLSGITWTAVAAGISLYLKSGYLVFIFPYLLSRMYIEIAKILEIPYTMRIDRWFTGMSQPFAIPLCLGILCGFSIIIFLISTGVFGRILRWRLENG